MKNKYIYSFSDTEIFEELTQEMIDSPPDVKKRHKSLPKFHTRSWSAYLLMQWNSVNESCKVFQIQMHGCKQWSTNVNTGDVRLCSVNCECDIDFFVCSAFQSAELLQKPLYPDRMRKNWRFPWRRWRKWSRYIISPDTWRTPNFHKQFFVIP